jgi:hypothetical protein
VDFVWENQFLDVDLLHPQALQQVRGLREVDVAIIVSMNQQNW